MVVFDAAINQVVTEQLKEKIGFTAPSHSRNDFYQPVFSMLYELVKIIVAFDLHNTLRIVL